LPVIIISGVAPSVNVVEAMKNGANYFIPKPIRPEDLRALKIALDSKPPPPRAAEQPSSPPKTEIFFGNSRNMRELQRLIAQIGWSEAPGWIQGETGAGKEVLARELHAQSPARENHSSN
jgi:DNA-binding NtrC family response regulator